MNAAEAAFVLMYLIFEYDWRRRYREERKHPEWCDLGGES